MNQDIPFEEYMPGGSSQPTSQNPQDPSPSAFKTSISELDSSCHHHSATISSCPDSPLSSSINSDPHDPAEEISTFEQEVIDLYKMARLDDDSGLESECADENDGGVTLAGHEDTTDMDGTAADRDYPGAAAGQGFSAPSGITQLTA